VTDRPIAAVKLWREVHYHRGGALAARRRFCETLRPSASNKTPSASRPLTTSRRKDLRRSGNFTAGRQRSHRSVDVHVAPVTVLVPAFNESASIADTIRSLQAQTLRVAEIIVIDDCSTDDTAAVAQSLGVRVIRPPRNTGSKAGAQNYALQFVETPFTMAIDGDTTLDAEAIARLLPALQDATVGAACGFVLPRHVRTIWERGRYIEYLFAFTFYKQVQDFYGKPLIASGCFSVYRTDVLRELGGWGTRTLAEDMDLTWSLYQGGHGVRFVPDAVCYPIEPHDFGFMSKQLKRWSHGFVQNVRLHWRGLVHVPFLRSAVAVVMWDATLAALVYFIALPVLAMAFSNPWFLLGYVIDAPAMAVPVLVGAWKRGETMKALASLPAFLLLRVVNALFFLRAAWTELVLRRSFRIYEKGH
jgi:cellulose synthase/poly-beta-1,6-N-acetylglucosamine synthase-like glycosyltransferase